MSKRKLPGATAEALSRGELNERPVTAPDLPGAS